jgi:hypothetical protein
MRRPAHSLFVLVCGALLLVAQTGSAICDGAQEEIDSTRQNILQGVRDEIQRKTMHPTGEAEPNAETGDSGAARQTTRPRSPRIRHKSIKADKSASP